MEKYHHYYVYILKCNDGTYCTGVTNSIWRRMDEHENGMNPKCYTASRHPLELVYVEVSYSTGKAG